ncbi:MAG TPA: 5'/3'-nucleotidase SurE, partial [Gemmatimonadales bacterium]|nr:5'/3'-nucleotidase SurE [Gemmatimonadales bacterium]
MRILCTNDDGLHSLGLEVLIDVCSAIAPVACVAPDREQSATSHSLTLHRPLRPIARGPDRWQVDGTPTDCVVLALGALLAPVPDFVVAGINHGPNMGEDVLYSGTVAAAMEGLILGVPGVAVSF